MNVDTTKRRILKYLDYKDITQVDFLAKTGIKRGFLDADKLDRSVSDQFLQIIIATFVDLSLEWLVTGQGSMIKDDIDSKPSNVLPIDFASAIDMIEVPIVEVYAAAGYGSLNPDHIERIGSIRLPANMLNRGTHYCVRIEGHSMSPTIQDSDYVIVRLLDPSDWKYMHDEHVYLVVDVDGAAYMKRIKNRFSKGFIVCMSDNIEKNVYPNFNLQADQIVNIFHAEWHFSAKMQNINETYYSRLKLVEDDLADIKESIKRIK